MDDIILKLKDAQLKAWQLISVAEQKGFITAGQTEKELNENIYQLAKELFGIKKFCTNVLSAPERTPYSLTKRIRKI